MVKSKKRLLLAGIFVVVIAAIGVQKVVQAKAAGRAVVFAPADRAVEVKVDGKPYAIAAGAYVRISLGHGAHAVEVAGGPKREVAITSGRDLIAVPTEDAQCFAELDVTLSHYGKGGVPPTVTRQFRRDRPFQLPTTYALSKAELPKEQVNRTRGGKIVSVGLVHMFRTVRCDPATTYDSSVL